MVVATCATVALWLNPISAGAYSDPCGAVSTSAVAKAFGLAHAKQYYHSTIPSGTGSGEVSSVCRYDAWSGGIPKNVNQVTEKVNHGKGALVTIKAQAIDASDPNAMTESWATKGFNDALLSVTLGAEASLLKALHGSTFVPPRFGAEHAVADRADSHGRREVLGIWWSASTYALVTIDVVAAKSKAVRGLRAPIKMTPHVG
ncbi:MAG: hypothetical protein ACYDA6_04595 [Solirubrobacteraceae bacterium]